MQLRFSNICHPQNLRFCVCSTFFVSSSIWFICHFGSFINIPPSFRCIYCHFRNAKMKNIYGKIEFKKTIARNNALYACVKVESSLQTTSKYTNIHETRNISDIYFAVWAHEYIIFKCDASCYKTLLVTGLVTVTMFRIKLDRAKIAQKCGRLQSMGDTMWEMLEICK